MSRLLYSHRDQINVNRPIGCDLSEALDYLAAFERDDLPGRFNAHRPQVVARF